VARAFGFEVRGPNRQPAVFAEGSREMMIVIALVARPAPHPVPGHFTTLPSPPGGEGPG
jgi:hypothetical protein